MKTANQNLPLLLGFVLTLVTSDASVASIGPLLSEKKLTASDAAPDDDFGFAAAISQDTAIIGAPEDDDAGGESGAGQTAISGRVSRERTRRSLALASLVVAPHRTFG